VCRASQSVLIVLSLVGCVKTANDFKTAHVNGSMANLFCEDVPYIDGFNKVSPVACLAFCDPVFYASEETINDGVFYMKSSGHCRCYPDYKQNWSCNSVPGYKFIYYEGKYKTILYPV